MKTRFRAFKNGNIFLCSKSKDVKKVFKKRKNDVFEVFYLMHKTEKHLISVHECTPKSFINLDSEYVLGEVEGFTIFFYRFKLESVEYKGEYTVVKGEQLYTVTGL